MSFLATIASMFPGTKRGKKWTDAMNAIAATKTAEAAKKKAEDAFLALSADEQVGLVHRAWVVATPERVRAREALVAALLPWAKEKFGSKNGDGAMENGSKMKKVAFEEDDPIIKKVPRCLLQSSDPWKFVKAKVSPFSRDMEYLAGPEMARLRAAQLAAELSR